MCVLRCNANRAFMTELAKTFEPGLIEARWYEHWEGQGLFRPERPTAEPFSGVRFSWPLTATRVMTSATSWKMNARPPRAPTMMMIKPISSPLSTRSMLVGRSTYKPSKTPRFASTTASA